MGSKHNQKRMNVDDNDDRLSSLSDDLIHKVFSRISTKLVVQTSILSSRWRFIWTSIPYLNLSIQDFPTSSKFAKFVINVLSRRNTEIEVSSVKLSCGRTVSNGFVKVIMGCVFSHIQQLNLSRLILDRGSQFPLSFITFPSLKYLGLSDGMHMSSFELPAALTTLYLHCVVWSNELFSKCANLKNLTLQSCQNVKSENFSISHPQLSNLTLDNNYIGNIVAPKLENLTIRDSWNSKEYVIKIYAPDLTSFVYWGEYCSLSLSTDGFNSLKKANIYVSQQNDKYGYSRLLCLLQHIHNVKFLTLSMKILKLLSSHADKRILSQPFVFTNLKRLKICTQNVSSQRQATPNNSYYLDISPGAKLEEIVAQNLMVELRMLLEQEKTNTKTDMTQMERYWKDLTNSHGGKMLEHQKSQADTKLQIVKSMGAKIDDCLESLRVQIDQRKSKYRLIISKLQKIEAFLEKLPASRRALIQPRLASLYSEAVIVMGGITDLMKTRCDQNESRMSVCIQELATTLKPSY